MSSIARLEGNAEFFEWRCLTQPESMSCSSHGLKNVALKWCMRSSVFPVKTPEKLPKSCYYSSSKRIRIDGTVNNKRYYDILPMASRGASPIPYVLPFWSTRGGILAQPARTTLGCIGYQFRKKHVHRTAKDISSFFYESFGSQKSENC